jgi:Methylamine utilisation protein MauE
VTPALDPALLAALRCALALLWLDSARHKLRDPVRFRAALAGYRLIPAPALRAVAAAVAVLELLLAVALLAPATGAGAALASAALLALYALAIAANLARGLRGIDCGCGARPQPLGEGLLARNAVLTLIALAAALPTSGRALTGIDAVSILGGAAGLAALYAAIDTALANGARSRVLRAGA